MRTNLFKRKDDNNFELEDMAASSLENAQVFNCIQEDQIKWETNSCIKCGFECIGHHKNFKCLLFKDLNEQIMIISVEKHQFPIIYKY